MRLKPPFERITIEPEKWAGSPVFAAFASR
jgi:hypothetical protein